MPVTKSRLAPALCGLALTLPALPTAQAEEIDELTKRLVQLRSDVDDLHSELSLRKEEHKQRMKYLYSQQGETDAQVRRREGEIANLQNALKKSRENARAAGTNAEVLRPVVAKAIDALKRDIENGLPFKQQQRLAELAEISQQLEAEVIAPQKAANRLWAFYEDELRLTRENGIYKQAIPLDSGETLAEVARLGTVMMYFRTSDDQLGLVKRAPEGWDYRLVHDGEQRSQIDQLFGSLKKQVRSGYFELPNALPQYNDSKNAL